MNQLFILTGVSGSGKSTIRHTFEEKGFRIIENVPVSVFPTLLSEIDSGNPAYAKCLFLCMLSEAEDIIVLAKAAKNIKLKVVLLDCDMAELKTRFRLTRHVHPLEAEGLDLDTCLEKDKAIVVSLRKYANVLIDTTGISSNELRKLAFSVVGLEEEHRLTVVFSSFGYKFGIPSDAETVFDVRSIPNPYWINELREKNGLDPDVVAFLDSKKEVAECMDKITAYLDFLLDKLERDSKLVVNIDIGCTGGQHRSVYIAQKLYEKYKENFTCEIIHHDLPRYLKKNG